MRYRLLFSFLKSSLLTKGIGKIRLFLNVDIYNNIEEIEKYFIDYDINKLDIKRIFRFLDKNVKKDNNEILNEDE